MVLLDQPIPARTPKINSVLANEDSVANLFSKNITIDETVSKESSITKKSDSKDNVIVFVKNIKDELSEDTHQSCEQQKTFVRIEDTSPEGKRSFHVSPDLNREITEPGFGLSNEKVIEEDGGISSRNLQPAVFTMKPNKSKFSNTSDQRAGSTEQTIKSGEIIEEGKYANASFKLINKKISTTRVSFNRPTLATQVDTSKNEGGFMLRSHAISPVLGGNLLSSYKTSQIPS
eukprot:CAMPEP_0170485474 /NCGR_PEP_ID=MMETSP0208-20121228/4745_1 /TAXON_ID=197538 /ORGANISM="Strombidium inclinatum, Strain S3" /LENGTH=231 /DNA_ID=CAMNT_0010759151 /DNA_START=2649 /DNA_END=3344 /DNA_ORIENTATION=+